MKQVRPANGTVPSSTAALSVGEGGQPASEVGLVVVTTDVTPNTFSSILAKRKRDNVVKQIEVVPASNKH